jgi:hypothetical protein
MIWRSASQAFSVRLGTFDSQRRTLKVRWAAIAGFIAAPMLLENCLAVEPQQAQWLRQSRPLLSRNDRMIPPSPSEHSLDVYHFALTAATPARSAFTALMIVESLSARCAVYSRLPDRP